jgi:hypothetical protein
MLREQFNYKTVAIVGRLEPGGRRVGADGVP